MDTVRKIAKNTLVSSVSEIITKIVYFVLTLVIARLLGKGYLGKFNFALSFSTFMLIVADIGLSMLLIRDIARDRSLTNKLVINAFLIKAVTSLVTVFATYTALEILEYPLSTKLVTYAMVLFIVLRSFTEILFSVFRAYEKMEYDSLIRALRMILILPIAAYAIIKGHGLFVAVLSFPVVEFFILVGTIIVAVTKFYKVRWEPDFNFSRQLFMRALPFGFALVFSSMYFYIGSIILSKVKGDEALGIYAAAYNFCLALLFIPAMSTTAIYPRLSTYFKASKEKFRKLYEYSFKYLYIIGLPLSVGAFMLSDRMMTMLYGKAFLESGLALQILAGYLVIKFINFLLGIVLYSMNRQKKRMISQAVTSAINLALNLMLIPWLGIVGAAISTLITEVILFVLYYYFVSHGFYYFNFLRTLIKPLVAVVVMAGIVHTLRDYVVMAILSGAGIYGLTLLALKVFTAEDKEIFKRLVKQ